MAFETGKTKTTLPEGVPNATQAASEAPDGSVWRIESGPHAGRRFRLRHARWVEILPRNPAGKSKAASK